MRFMLMIKADKNTEAGVLPSKELVAAMDDFNQEMVKAGVMLAGEGLHPSSKGARITFHGYRMMLIRSPSSESLAVITRAFAWNDRCVLMRSMNSWAICTFDCSSAEDTIVPLPCEPAVAMAAGPESTDAR